ncbi:MAG: methyltransferase domain-containing protein [Armatimonadetes bacterium]|nr:methyltransferase domain-containing protein [Armatimonadota bacterium]
MGRAEDIPLPAGSVDFMFSHSVLQHVGDLDRAFESMSRVLSPAGVAVHHIDLKDHGMSRSKNPLLMMQFPRWLWDLCTRNAPDAINRARLGRYLELASKHGLEAQVLSSTVTDELPVPRRALAPEFRDLPDEDLCTLAADILFRSIA